MNKNQRAIFLSFLFFLFAIPGAFAQTGALPYHYKITARTGTGGAGNDYVLTFEIHDANHVVKGTRTFNYSSAAGADEIKAGIAAQVRAQAAGDAGSTASLISGMIGVDDDMDSAPSAANASTTQRGVAMLAVDNEATAGKPMKSDDPRGSNDRVANNLRSATTVVGISAAAAPSAGKVLTASSPTAADWQTPVAIAHNILSATHSDSSAAALVRGDGLFAIGATPTLQRVARSAATGGYWKWNGTDVVASTLAAAGTGSPTACTTGAVTAFTLNADAAPASTCTPISSALVDAATIPRQPAAGGTKALATTAIAANTCSAAQTLAVTGTATSSVVFWDFATTPIGVTGYGTAGLAIVTFATANTANIVVCNRTAASITPGAMTLNVRVIL